MVSFGLASFTIKLRGIRLDKELYVSKFRFNQSFHLISAEEFLKALMNSSAFQSRMPSFSYGKIEHLNFKAMSCNVLNMSYFDFLEQLDLVNTHTGQLKGAPDEWVDGIQCSTKLRLAMLWEEDENYCEIQQDKYQNEFIFKLFQLLIVGGPMCQYDDDVTEYLTQTKNLYKDLVTVAKDQETGEIKS